MNDTYTKPEVTKVAKGDGPVRKRRRGPIEWRDSDGMTPNERQAYFNAHAPSKPKTR